MRSNKRTLALLALLVAACDGGTGELSLRLEPEQTIANGVAAGNRPQDIVDGFHLAFDKYIVSIGGVSVERSGSSARFSSEGFLVVDLAQLPASGTELVRFEGLAARRWDRVSYGLRAPTSETARHGSVGDADFDAMVAGGCTFYIEGRITPASSGMMSTPPGGSARPVPVEGISFSLCVPADVDFVACAINGVPGVSIPSGGSAVANFTLHGDHILFPSFLGGEEIVQRRAQWLANADLNGDDEVTREELEGITGALLVELFPPDLDPGMPGNQGYDLTGSPSGTITSAFGFVVEQLRTQGHMNGEGECTPIVP